MKSPKGQTISGPWVIKKEEFDRLAKADLIHWSEGKKETPYKKVYLEDTGGISPPDNFWDSKIHGSNQDGSLDIERVFGTKSVLEFPKPVELMKSILKIGCSDGDLVVDFFAGSCSMGQALLELNREDGKTRRLILVQLPEPCPPESIAAQAGLKTISEIGKERMRRVAAALRKEAKEKLPKKRPTPEDLGMKVFKLAKSNYRSWTGVEDKRPETYAKQMEAYVDPLVSGWSAESVIYEVGLKEGLALDLALEPMPPKDNRIHKVSSSFAKKWLYICLDDKIKTAAVKALKLAKEDLFVCRDTALDDTIAANLMLQCNLKTI